MSSAERIGFEKRKLTPGSRRNHGVIHNGPEAPSIQRRELGELAVILPNHSTGIPNGHLVVEDTIIQGRYTWRRGHRVTPTTEIPLTQFFTTSRGGGRVGGGGTSREALRRARRKARNIP